MTPASAGAAVPIELTLAGTPEEEPAWCFVVTP